mgnify:FL=1
MLQFSHLFFMQYAQVFFVTIHKKEGESSTSSLFQDSSPEFLL